MGVTLDLLAHRFLQTSLSLLALSLDSKHLKGCTQSGKLLRKEETMALAPSHPYRKHAELLVCKISVPWGTGYSRCACWEATAGLEGSGLPMTCHPSQTTAAV